MLSPVKAITAGAFIFAIGGAFLIAQPFGQQQSSVPGALMEGVGTTTYMLNVTCESGQESPLGLPPCEFDEENAGRSGFGRVLDEGHGYFTMLNPATTTGVLEGMQVLDAVGVQDMSSNSFTGSGLLFWAGTVEGCGAGTFYAEAEFAGVPVQVYDSESGNFVGVNDFSVNSFTIVPGGSLPITGTWDGAGTEVPNADGSRSNASTFTYSCEGASE